MFGELMADGLSMLFPWVYFIGYSCQNIRLFIRLIIESNFMPFGLYIELLIKKRVQA